MEVIATPSFFKSLKDIDSLKNKYYKIRSWFRYHFSKDFFKILKTVLRGYPWQESYLYDLEKVKMNEMANYLEKANRFVGVEYVVRDIRLCIKMLYIIDNETNLFHYDGDLKFIPIEDGNYTVEHSDDFKYHCNVYVNTRNIDRFCFNDDDKKFMLKSPHELYIRKAKYLYHKIRYERDNQWWD